MLRFLQWLTRQEWLLRALRPLFGRFDPFLPEHRRDPQTTWRALRSSGPIYRSRVFGIFLCTRYDDVLRDPCFSTDRSGVPAMRLIGHLVRREPDFAGNAGAQPPLGSQVARLEAEVALGALLRRFPDFSGDPEPRAWRRSMIIRGPEAVPLRLV